MIFLFRPNPNDVAVLLVCMCMLCEVMQSENPRTDSATKRPRQSTYHIIGSLSCSQSQSYDWMSGDKSILDVKAKLRHASSHLLAPLVVTTESRMMLGLTRVSPGSSPNEHVRTSDNDLQAECKVVLPVGWIIDPYLAASLKSTITESFRESPTGDTRTATFWDPVTSEQACGMQFSRMTPRGSFSIRTGANVQQIRSAYHTTLTDDPQTRFIHERYKASAGMECQLQTSMQLDSSITYTGLCQTRKNLVTNDSWQLKMDNELRIKFWRVFAIFIEANVIYDDTASKRVQFRQSTQIGVLIDY